jgi:hypothetical protein
VDQVEIRTRPAPSGYQARVSRTPARPGGMEAQDFKGCVSGKGVTLAVVLCTPSPRSVLGQVAGGLVGHLDRAAHARVKNSIACRMRSGACGKGFSLPGGVRLISR